MSLLTFWLWVEIIFQREHVIISPMHTWVLPLINWLSASSKGLLLPASVQAVLLEERGGTTVFHHPKHVLMAPLLQYPLNWKGPKMPLVKRINGGTCKIASEKERPGHKAQRRTSSHMNSLSLSFHQRCSRSQLYQLFSWWDSQRHLTQHSRVPVGRTRFIQWQQDIILMVWRLTSAWNKTKQTNKTNQPNKQKPKTFEEEEYSFQHLQMHLQDSRLSISQEFYCECSVLLNPVYRCKTNISMLLHTVFTKHLRIIYKASQNMVFNPGKESKQFFFIYFY